MAESKVRTCKDALYIRRRDDACTFLNMEEECDVRMYICVYVEFYLVILSSRLVLSLLPVVNSKLRYTHDCRTHLPCSLLATS